MTRLAKTATVTLLAIALVAVSASAVATGSRMMMVAGVVLALTPIGLFLLLKQPTWLAAAPGIVLGFMPFAAAPGTGLHLVIALSALLIVLAAMHPTDRHPRFGAISVAMVALLALSFVSAIATFNGAQTLLEYAKWALASSTMLSVVAMQSRLREVLLKTFSASAAIGALFTLGMLVVDSSGGWIERFGLFGYGGSAAVNQRTAITASGEVFRAAGLYVDPNSAGLIFLFAIAAAVTTYTGILRVLVIGALSAGVLGTLSRAAIATLIVGALVSLLFSRLTAGRKFAGATLLGSSLIAVLMVPAISSRLLDSFGSDDKGTTDRIDALERYPGHMAGNWWFGRGWDLREFSDPIYGYAINHAANTPLIVIYRAGLLAGLAFVAILALALIFAIRTTTNHLPGAALQLGIMMGLFFIAFQFDFPVVTMPPLAMAFALMLGAVEAPGRSAPTEIVLPPSSSLVERVSAS